MKRKLTTNSRLVNELFANYISTFSAFCELINNSLQVKGSTINLTNQGVVVSLKDNINPALSIKEGSNTYLDFQTTDLTEKIIAYKDVSFLQNGYFGSGINNKLYFRP